MNSLFGLSFINGINKQGGNASVKLAMTIGLLSLPLMLVDRNSIINASKPSGDPIDPSEIQPTDINNDIYMWELEKDYTIPLLSHYEKRKWRNSRLISNSGDQKLSGLGVCRLMAEIDNEPKLPNMNKEPAKKLIAMTFNEKGRPVFSIEYSPEERVCRAFDLRPIGVG